MHLEKLENICVDSITLKNVHLIFKFLNLLFFIKLLHEFGINIRLLGHLCKLTEYTFLKEVFIVEMISRAAKKILNLHLS